MKKAVIAVAAVVLTALIGMSVALIVQETKKNDREIDLTASGGTVAAFEVKDLLPGETRRKEYEITGAEGASRFGMSFAAGKESGLVGYLRVRVSVNGKELYGGALEDLLGSELTAETTGETKVLVEYALPLETGNGAKGEKADVKITFRISNEK